MSTERGRERRAPGAAGAVVAVVAGLALIAGAWAAVSGLFGQGAEQPAREDLAAIAAAESSAHAAGGEFWAYQDHPESEWHRLAAPGSGVAYAVSRNVDAIVDVTDDGQGWVAATRSESGRIYLRSSASDRVGEVSADRAIPADFPLPAGYTIELLRWLVDDLADEEVHDFTHGGARGDVPGRS